MNSFHRYVFKRVLISFLIIFVILVFTFSIIRIMPGDPVRVMLGSEADQAIVDKIREELHLNEPIVTQFFIWIKDLFNGDFGRSLILNQDIGVMMSVRLPVTLSLTIPSLIISTFFGIIVGIVCATHRGKLVDQALSVIVATTNGVPVFWIGIILMYIFGTILGWLPTVGYTSPFEDFFGYIKKAIIPITVLGFRPFSLVARQVRTTMLEVIGQDYIRTEMAYGISNTRIKYSYALKNTLIPVVTVLALQVRTVAGGSLLVEQIFSIGGMGRLIMTSILSKDYLVIQVLVLVISLFVVFCNLLLDISYGWIDPRIRLAGRKS
jgi:peptide/nickel transport system permease protein